MIIVLKDNSSPDFSISLAEQLFQENTVTIIKIITKMITIGNPFAFNSFILGVV